jgi:hypothetical protein
MKTLSRKSIVLPVEGKVTTFQISKSKCQKYLFPGMLE